MKKWLAIGGLILVTVIWEAALSQVIWHWKHEAFPDYDGKIFVGICADGDDQHGTA